MSASTRRQEVGVPCRRVEYTEQPIPSSTTAHTVDSRPPVAPAASSNISSTLATRASPRRLPTPFENSRRTGGRPVQLGVYEPHHDSASSIHFHSCASLDCAMEKAMNTVEILEHICASLPTRKVLSLQLVSRKWRSLIHDSPQLSLHFFVEPRWTFPSTKFQLLTLAIPGLEIKRGEPVHLGQWVEVRMTPEAAKTIMTTVEKIHNAGNATIPLHSQNSLIIRRSAVPIVPPKSSTRPNHANLFITQPPLKGMHAFFVDAHDATLETEASKDRYITVPRPHAKMSCDAGITLGFLAEVAEWMFEEREKLRQREDDGSKVAVFKAIVSHCVQSDAAPRMRSATRTVTEIESLQ